jgi:hypothetical protein
VNVKKLYIQKIFNLNWMSGWKSPPPSNKQQDIAVVAAIVSVCQQQTAIDTSI